MSFPHSISVWGKISLKRVQLSIATEKIERKLGYLLHSIEQKKVNKNIFYLIASFKVWGYIEADLKNLEAVLEPQIENITKNKYKVVFCFAKMTFL